MLNVKDVDVSKQVEYQNERKKVDLKVSGHFFSEMPSLDIALTLLV